MRGEGINGLSGRGYVTKNMGGGGRKVSFHFYYILLYTIIRHFDPLNRVLIVLRVRKPPINLTAI